MFNGLTLAEWDALCSKMESAMARLITAPICAPATLEWIREIHGDLMLTWHGVAELELMLAIS